MLKKLQIEDVNSNFLSLNTHSYIQMSIIFSAKKFFKL